jgi:non-ribosomal peptide synthetase component F
VDQQPRAYPVNNEWFSLSPELSAQLAQLSRQAGTTLAITVLAGYAALLHHYSGCTDLLLGTPINRRNFPELEGVVGYLSTVSLLLLNLVNAPSWRELIERARSAMLETITQQDITLRQLLHTTGSDWLPGKPPRPQANFNFLPEADGNINLPNVTVTPYGEGGRAYLMVEFSLLCWRTQNEAGKEFLQGFFAYRPDLFKQSTVQQMIGTFQRLLATMVANPDQTIAQADLIGNTAKDRVIV